MVRTEVQVDYGLECENGTFRHFSSLFVTLELVIFDEKWSPAYGGGMVVPYHTILVWYHTTIWYMTVSCNNFFSPILMRDDLLCEAQHAPACPITPNKRERSLILLTVIMSNIRPLCRKSHSHLRYFRTCRTSVRRHSSEYQEQNPPFEFIDQAYHRRPWFTHQDGGKNGDSGVRPEVCTRSCTGVWNTRVGYVNSYSTMYDCTKALFSRLVIPYKTATGAIATVEANSKLWPSRIVFSKTMIPYASWLTWCKVK